MKRVLSTVGGGAVLAAAALVLYPQPRRTEEAAMPPAVSFRILFGKGAKEPAVWDGKATPSEGRILSIQGWRFADTDLATESSWTASTRRGIVPPAAAAAGQPGPMLDNGVILTAEIPHPGASFQVETAQGSFSFRARDMPFGKPQPVLEGRASVERVPVTRQLTSSAEEQDFPALAESGDDVWLAYVEFTHGDRAQAVPGQFRASPESFDFLARPVGGDQVKLMRYSKSRRTWSEPENVSPPGGDIMRTAVAVDGRNRVWVFWSASRGGNFDIYARARSNRGWSPELRLTTSAGSDVNPVAASDSRGRVWVAWQGFRDGNLDILAAAQRDDRFTTEARVSTSTHSDWDAAIASAANGEVAVAWDTYDKGDYDVWVRKLSLDGRRVKMDAPVPVAASTYFEARPSIAYDDRNRLWVAYEASDAKWGKDFGAYETTGIGLYQGHNLRVKCFDGQAALVTADDVGATLQPARSDPRPGRALLEPADATQPNPNLSLNRTPSQTPQPPPLPKNSFPRLASDPSGMIYLAYRTGTPVRVAVGWIWEEHLVWFDGERWSGPAAVPHSDGLLDNRPALATLGPGRLMMVVTTDHRQLVGRAGPPRAGAEINSDLFAAELSIEGGPKPAKLSAAAAETVAPADPDVKPERDQVARIRGYRLPAGGAQLQLLRGEFHRHTEISADGGMGDGPVIDAYRYMIDAAYMDWGGCCDHDNGGGREYSWWIEQKLTDAYHLAGAYTAMFSYERSVRYPEGHRNTIFARRGIRPLPRLAPISDEEPSAPAPDTQMLYRYLRHFDGIVASHTSGTNMGTDWRDNDPIVEPVVEIYQGDRQNYEMPDAPRSNSAGDSIGGWRPLGFVSLALEKGYRLGFQASSDHVSTHMSYCNLWVTTPTREAVLEAFKKRRVYGATDNILADVRSGEHMMGEEFSVDEPPSISVKLWGTGDFAKVHIVRDNQYVYSVEPRSPAVEFTWRDEAAQKGKTSYYYVRGEQADGELVWVSPMWITYR